MALTLTRTVDIAVLALVSLADRTDGKSFRNVPEIAKKRRISPLFIQRIMPALKRAGLVTATRGKFGGYMLGRHAEEISLGDIVAAVDGEMQIMSCRVQTTDGELRCPESGRCSAEDGFTRLRSDLSELLDSYLLIDFLTPQQKEAYETAERQRGLSRATHHGDAS